VETLAQKALVGVAVTYMLLIVIIPFVNVFVQAFSHGLGPFVETLQEPDFQQARRRAEGLCLAVFIVFKYCVAGSSGCGAARKMHPPTAASTP
jgi:sulfate transport system permease protein